MMEGIRNELGALWRDVKHAARGLARTRGFTAVAVATVAIGIGSNTAVYTVVRGVLMQPLPYEAPDRLVKLGGFVPGVGTSELAGSPAELYDYRERATTLDAVTGVWPLHTNLVGGNQPVRLSMALVHWNFLDVLGVRPALGRGFDPDEMISGVGIGMILSWDAWQRQFGGDASVVGSTVNIDGDPVEVIGIMPEGFHHPGEPLGAEIEAWGTMDFEPGGRWFFRTSRPLQLFARLVDGASIEDARNELFQISNDLRAEYPEAYPAGAGWMTGVEPLSQEVFGGMKLVLLILMGAVGFVLLVTCANLSALLISRTAARGRQTAVRLAIGSSRWDIARYNLAEGFILSAAGALVATAVTLGTTDALRAFASQYLPRAELIESDLGLVGFCLLVSLASGVVFGLAPALVASATHPRDLLAGGQRGSSRAGSRLRDGLVVAEIGTAVVLVVGSGLLVTSFRNLMSVDMGFEPADVHVAQTYLPVQIDPNEGQWRSFPNRVGFYTEVMRLLEEEPTVTAAAGISHLPLRETNGLRFVIEGEEVEATARPNAEYRVTSEKYFDVMGIPLIRGRTFTAGDNSDAGNALIVNQAWVDQHASGRDPLQLRIRLGNGNDGPIWQVVGVVGDVRLQSLDVAARPTIYAPYRQAAGHDMTFVFAGAGPSGDLLDAARSIVQRVDRDQPAFGLATMDNVVAASVAEREILVRMVTLFGSMALALAGLGIFGVVSFTVRQRMREIGIRLTLGARPSSVAALVLTDGVKLGLVGVALGLAGASIATGAIQSMLFGVERFNAPVLIAVATGTLGVVIVGCLLPARWASRVDPVEVLDAEE